MMEDGRDEALNGYDTLVRSFDLEPPEGFSNMAEFQCRAERMRWTACIPRRANIIDQSLRGGTQTPDHLFGAGHAAGGQSCKRGSTRRWRAISPSWREDAAHPFLSRRGTRISAMPAPGRRGCAIAAFTSIISIPMGWISSCYYVAVPDAVKDETAQAGLDQVRRAVLGCRAEKSRPPRHPAGAGTAGAVSLLYVARHHPVSRPRRRTTIAFDVVPQKSLKLQQISDLV